ncbi:SpoIIE family protein phosphatase [Chitinimonas lacunae]|uniref:SpoIIE family protein phosphatase n=1 Tax=Chitinimonas lacunae TaxID=1963018 RepID=A0ABV8MMW5_9NEIS
MPPIAFSKRLKTRFALAVLLIYSLTVTLTFIAYRWVAESLAESLGSAYAERLALHGKARVLEPISRELGLARKLADSPLLKSWAAREEDPQLTRQALAELASYRRWFADGSYFFVVAQSGHYYFDDGSTRYRTNPILQTMQREQPADSWYFSTLNTVEDYALNVDYNAVSRTTKVWINVIVKEGGRKLGIAGSGLDLSRFLETFVADRQRGVEVSLIDAAGAIKAHRERSLIDLNSVGKRNDARSTFFRLLNEESAAALKDAMAELKRGQRDVATLFAQLDGRRQLLGLSYLPAIDWYAVVAVDLDLVLGLERFTPALEVSLLGMLVVALSLGWLMNRLVLHRLARLNNSVAEVAAGHYQVRLPVDHDDELGRLSATFNEMAATVHDYTDNLERKVAERTQALQTANDKLVESLRYASLIQASLLPPTERLSAEFADHFVLQRPRAEVGGDFYCLHRHGERHYVGMVDCTGHGVAAAFLTMTAAAVIEQAIAAVGEYGPSAVIIYASNSFSNVLRRSESREAALSTGFDIGLLCWDEGSPTARFAGLGISLFVAQDGEIREYKSAVSGRGGQHATEQALSWSPQQVYYLCSDGLFDQGGGPSGYAFGKTRLTALLAEIASQPLAQQGEQLTAALREWQGSRDQRDDITALGFRPQQIKDRAS